MSELKARLSAEMKTAMKAGEKDRLAFTRNLFAAVRKKEIDDRVDVTDDDFMKIVQTAVKQRQDSISQFRQGGREDLVVKEEAELLFLQGYLPAQASDEQIKEWVQSAIQETQATNAKDMGKVMKALLPKVQGRADNKKVSEMVKNLLGG